MIKKVVTILVLFLLAVVIISTQKGWEVLKVENGTIYYKNGHSFDSNLYDMKYIGQLEARGGIPYVIMSGRSCNECDENIAIYIEPASGGDIDAQNGRKRYSYPGQVFDYMDNALVFKSRFFYGNCFANGSDIAVWVQEYADENNLPAKEIFFLEASEKGLTEMVEVYSEVTLSMFENNCTEVKGVDYYLEP